MKLPFVSVAAFDLVADALAKSEAREAKWVERYDALLVQYDAATKKPEEPAPKARSRDEVIEAIMMRAGSRGDVRAALGAYARRARAEQVPDDQIIQHILFWESPNDDDPSAGVP
jgi:hypothetical protein